MEFIDPFEQKYRFTELFKSFRSLNPEYKTIHQRKFRHYILPLGEKHHFVHHEKLKTSSSGWRTDSKTKVLPG